MRGFEEGQRVRYVGVERLGSKWKGRVGVVKEIYRATEQMFIDVQFEGEDRVVSFDPEDFEAVKETYLIENFGEDSTIAVMELDDVELALIEKLVEQLNDNRPLYAPDMTITKQVKK